MCGIHGLLTPGGLDRAATRALLADMGEVLRHRGPDSGGEWMDDAAGIALGHRRLSIIDLSAAGAQPMASASGRYVITLNGEIYNFQELRRELESDYRFRGHSDTEVALAGMERWGVEAAIPRLEGMFAFGVWDRHLRQLTLARDRMGEKPLYYTWLGGSLVFASQPAALACHPQWRGETEPAAVAALLRYGFIPGEQSIYQGVFRLPPGTWLQVEPDAQRRPPVRYWDLGQVADEGEDRPFAGDAEAASQVLEDLLRNSVRRQSFADVPVGVFLSGGIDSSTVAAIMQAVSARPQKTFTIGFHESGFDEAPRAAAIARHLGTEHTELYISTREAQQLIPRLGSIYDEPFADASQIPTCLLAEMTRRQVTVALSGDGGDELFGGYKKYDMAETAWQWLAPVPRVLRAAAGTLTRWVPPPPGPLGPQARQAWTRVRRIAPLLTAADRSAVFVAFWDLYFEPSFLAQAAEPSPMFLPPLANGNDYRRWMMQCDAGSYLPDDILVKVDRAAMAYSLETRVPLLDSAIVRFAASLPPQWMRQKPAKQLLRRVLARHVPRQLWEGPKRGFIIPRDEWLRGGLREWAEGLLTPPRLTDAGLNPAPIREVWRQHCAHRANAASMLWPLLMYQCWREANLGRPRRQAAAIPVPA